MSFLSSPLLSASGALYEPNPVQAQSDYEDDVPVVISSALLSKAWIDSMVISPLLPKSGNLPLPDETDEQVELTDLCDSSSRRQPALPAQPSSSTTFSRSAIPPLQSKPIFTTPSQDVPSVNASASSSRTPAPAPRTSASLNTETSVSTPFGQNDLTRRRIYSTPVCHTIQDLAAHHGIPQILPPAPRPRPSQNTAPTSPLPDFSALKSSYLSMISQPPQDSMETPVDTVSPSDLQTTGSDANATLESMFVSALANFLSPPMETPLQDFESSPFDSPFNDFLTTPVIGADDDMLTSPLFEDGQSFFELMGAEPESLSKPQEPELFTISPTSTPYIDAIDPSSLYSPRIITDPSPTPSTFAPSPAPSKSAASSTRRKPSATGTRKGLTVNSMVPIDAPTQPRNYVIPSSTSRKEVPAVIARKRARSLALGDDDDERLAPPPPTATEKEQIEWKRRQNTLAARKSRQRKLVYLQEVEGKLDEMTREAEKWRVRCQMLSHTLSTHSIPVPQFEDDD